MSKYSKLWNWIKTTKYNELKLTLSDIEEIAGVPIDHSFLKYKKGLEEYGYKTDKISMKDKSVSFSKLG